MHPCNKTILNCGIGQQDKHTHQQLPHKNLHTTHQAQHIRSEPTENIDHAHGKKKNPLKIPFVEENKNHTPRCSVQHN